jgi:hypothetical protein
MNRRDEIFVAASWTANTSGNRVFAMPGSAAAAYGDGSVTCMHAANLLRSVFANLHEHAQYVLRGIVVDMEIAARDR